MLDRVLAALPLVPILSPLVASLVLLLLRFWRPRFAFYWMLATLGAFFAWVSILLLRTQLPLDLSLGSWIPEALFPDSPALLLDAFSWPYALALATLLLGVILTDVARAGETGWTAWAGGLVIGALGLAAVMAGNMLTLLLAWTALDLFELTILLSQAPQSAERERIIITFFTRIAGTFITILAELVSVASGTRLTYQSIPTSAMAILLLGAWLRLGLFPLQSPFSRDLPLLRGQAALLRLTPAAASLPLAARVAAASSGDIAPFLVLLAALGALLGSIAWALANDELEGRQFWTLGMGALSLAAALRGQPEASLSFGMGLVLSGGMLFLFSARHRFLLPLPLLGLLISSTLPFTPAWQAVRLYEPPFRLLLPVFILAQALLMVGYVYHALQPGDNPYLKERWVLLIYPIGLVIFPLTAFLNAWWGPQNESLRPTLASSWPSAAILGLAILLVAWEQRAPRLPTAVIGRLRSTLSTDWFNRSFWGFYRGIRRAIAFVNLVLEGEGGILWTFLILTLLLSLLMQGGA